MYRDPGTVMAAVHSFVGLAPHELPRYEHYLAGKYERAIPEDARTRLSTYFAPHNRELFRWLGEKYDWV